MANRYIGQIYKSGLLNALQNVVLLGDKKPHIGRYKIGDRNSNGSFMVHEGCASTKNMTPEYFEVIRKSKVRKGEGNLRAHGSNTFLFGDDFILKPSQRI